ncbi:MAG: hypothetical protein BWY79_02042 [Actinobacteria bacterium ADurb.Bin444]|nr:MAG: hypothetical protein BWY79_02042 [Actinobacteria bacterium ADurb.Bin444]
MRADIKGLYQAFCQVAYLAAIHKAAPGNRWPVVIAHDEVVFHRERKDQTVVLPVFRDMAHTQLRNAARGGPCGIFTGNVHLAPRGLPQAGQGLHQLCLAVALHAGDS